MNERIRAPQVRVVADDGAQLGIMPTDQALSRAQQADLDLVEVAPNADPPVCKIMDYGKWRYEQDVKAKEARKKQAHMSVKEIRIRPKISSNDYGTKKRHAERFLNEGFKVKVAVWFRGREMSHPEQGERLLVQLREDLAEVATVELGPKMDGRNMIMVMAPVKKTGKAKESSDA